MRYKAAIFDMDGTVLDTSGDLTAALNYTFAQVGQEIKLTPKEAVFFYGSGIKVAIQRALLYTQGHALEELEAVGTAEDQLAASLDSALVEKMAEIFVPYYAEYSAELTGPYPGVIDLLKRLRAAGVTCAVVSNKPDIAVQKLVVDYYDGLFDFALGERKDLQRKPHPDMTLYALKQLGVTQKESVYIGDSEIDLQTAQNAGLDCISVDYGFRSHAFLKAHGAVNIVSSADAVGDYILQ